MSKKRSNINLSCSYDRVWFGHDSDGFRGKLVLFEFDSLTDTQNSIGS
jgi:hypothetical protein